MGSDTWVVCISKCCGMGGMGFLPRFYSLTADCCKWAFKCSDHKNLLPVQALGRVDLELAL